MQTSALRPHPTQPVDTRWRRIKTPIPAPESVPVIQRLRAAEPASMSGLPPILWHQAEGFLVRDPYGNQWIDLTSGIMLANAGHAHPRILEAIRIAADQQLLATYAFPSQARLALLEKLLERSPIPDSKAMLFNTGSEANECAIALMRRHGQSISPEKVGILSFAGGFHGRTLGAHLASGAPHSTDWIERQQASYSQIPFPFCPRCPWGRENYEQCGGWCFEQSLDLLAQGHVRPQHIAGIIAEPLTGATWPLPMDFGRALRQWATQHDILVCFDEVQAGCGRTGRFFAFEHVGAQPDLITLGKGLSSSLPVSALIGPRWLMDLPAPGEMSSTHAGNPLCAAAARANLEVIDSENLVEAAARTGQLVLAELGHLQRQFPQRVHSIHGPGLFISAHLKRPDNHEPDIALADAIATEAVRRGVMMFTTGRGYLKFTPPLCIDPEAALEAVGVIRDCFLELMD